VPTRFPLLARLSALAVVVGVLVGVDAISSAPADPSVAVPRPEVISPLPGTRDAEPDTQISFLGAPASRLGEITVTGSRSGTHSGVLRSYSTHTGGSFVPARPFEVGERVTVSAVLRSDGHDVHVGTTFVVGDPYVLPRPSAHARVAATASNVMRFNSRRDFEPPAATITTPARQPAQGDLFVAPDAGAGQSGPMILAPDGRLIWFDPVQPGQQAYDLDVQSYEGKPVLTWWQGTVVAGHGEGFDAIESAHYVRLANVRAGNGLAADLHDFQITPQGTAWLTAYEPLHMDLTRYGGLRSGLIEDGVVQEIDIRTGLVMFEWHAIGHVAIPDTYMRAPHEHGRLFDFFHVNSIDPLPNGELLVSSRNTWATYLISPRGAIVWRLGGKKSSFDLGDGVRFAWQHDVELSSNGTLTVFDNEAGPPEAHQSRGLEIALDESGHRATLVHQLIYPDRRILSPSQGDVQPLPGGDVMVGWGQIGEATEFAPDGAVTYDMHLAPPTSSYRAFRYPWHAQPLRQPMLRATAPSDGVTHMWVSWNGATDVAAWRVLAGTSRATLRTVATYPATGFETAIDARTTAPVVRVQALSAGGALLRSSRLVSTSAKG
jgi:Arylsulfotransferase (ASST)